MHITEVRGTHEDATWVARPVSTGFTLEFNRNGESFLHGHYVPVTVNEIRTSNSLVSEILRGAFGIEKAE